ncbi:FtsK/SpoIIIE domain-containing protein [Kitasatospora cineracea]|uniref:S-DNA-T family DNA segregation ATPase FtsK/SpoIIIE n=1 Tax=Kitasatospora cineracea TaxID=88074 RepID=A0A3N4R6L4_9ACTN|nr:FtsK/SpoIIIE domain-containing protein [Kitasatospora cineracea]RPE26615.1 S-DNA-T family DNA segregation ATPase FtsK/SpoIIIE [Kitasatospora cineracea]
MSEQIPAPQDSATGDARVVDFTKRLSPEALARLQADMQHAAIAGSAHGRAAAGIGTLTVEPAEDDDSVYADDDQEQGEALTGTVLPAQDQAPERTAWRHQPYRPVLPEAFASRAHFAAAAVDTYETAKNLGAYHGVRLPKYVWRATLTAGLGGWVALCDAYGYLTATAEYRDAIHAAKRIKGNGSELAELRAERKAVAKARRREVRTVAAALGLGTYVGLTLYVALAYGLLAASPAALLAYGTLLVLGRWERQRNAPEGEVWQLTDVQPLNAPERPLDLARVTEILRIVGVLKAEQTVEMVGLPMRDHVGQGIELTLKLPEGVTAKTVMGKAEPIAGALGIDTEWIDIRKAGTVNKVSLWHTKADPFEAPRRSPLVSYLGPLNAWRDGVPLAFNKRGKIIYVPIRDSHTLIGGATRSGKGMGIRNLVVGAGRDVRINIRLADGKPPEHGQYSKIAATMFNRNPERLLYLLEAEVAEIKRREREFMQARRIVLAEDMLHEFPVELVGVDELQTYTGVGDGDLDDDLREAILSAMVLIAAQGAQFGVLMFLATQYPSVKTVPEVIRSQCANCWCMRTSNYKGTNSILGDGMSGAGYKAEEISKDARGLGYLDMEGVGIQQARSMLIDGEKSDDLRVAIDAGYNLRGEAGRLPGQFEDPIEDYLIKKTGRTSAAGGTAGMGLPMLPAVGSRGILAQIRKAFEKAGNPPFLPSVKIAEILHAMDPAAGWAQQDGEADRTWATRIGTRLAAEFKKDLNGTGRTLASSKPDGQARGITLTDLLAAIGA